MDYTVGKLSNQFYLLKKTVVLSVRKPQLRQTKIHLDQRVISKDLVKLDLQRKITVELK